jgi:hypothetical protein
MDEFLHLLVRFEGGVFQQILFMLLVEFPPDVHVGHLLLSLEESAPPAGLAGFVQVHVQSPNRSEFVEAAFKVDVFEKL